MMKKIFLTIAILTIFIPSVLYANTFGEYIGAGSGTTKLLLRFSGSSADYSGNGNNGSDTNITYGLDYGRFGQGALSNNSNSQISFGTSFDTSTSGTISMWLKRTDPNSDETIYNFYDGTIAHNLCGLFNAGGNFGCFPYNSSSGAGFIMLSASDTNTLFNGNWHLVTMTFTSINSSTKIYVDGVNKAVTQGDGYVTNPQITGTLYFFKRGGDGLSGVYGGYIDEFIVENRVWTQQEIQKYYSMTKGRFVTN